MFGVTDERSPLLQFPGSYDSPQIEELPDAYKQFCHLIGNRPVDFPKDKSYYPPSESLYHRALEHRKWQAYMYAFTSSLVNTLLLSQIVLGAALTGLGASKSSPVVITIFGAANTIIAGLVAFLKSRGQPMRARMFRDDLDRVVDEIENSATMWKGISQKVHGYDAIDTDDSVTVRSEVARLTRLYDRAVRTNTMNDPDFYGAGMPTDPGSSGLRSRTGQPLLAAMPQNMPAALGGSASAAAPMPVIPGPAADPDESPATKAPTPPKKTEEAAKDTDPKSNGDKGKQPEEAKPTENSSAAPPAPPAAPPADPDASPATRNDVQKPKDDPSPSADTAQTDAGATKPS